MADKRTDPGQYYPGGRVIARQGTAPQQVVVDWNDIRNKPQVAPLPERFRDDDMKTKIDEIASKFATVLAVAVAGWTAFCGVTVHTAPKGEIWNDAQIVTNVTYSEDLPDNYAAVSNAALYASNRVETAIQPDDLIPVTNAAVSAANAYVDAKVGAIPAPDYSTGNAQLVATIQATAPAPGNYATISNRAMTAVQKQELAIATNAVLEMAQEIADEKAKKFEVKSPLEMKAKNYAWVNGGDIVVCYTKEIGWEEGWGAEAYLDRACTIPYEDYRVEMPFGERAVYRLYSYGRGWGDYVLDSPKVAIWEISIKATTLAGIGITDAYTKNEINAMVPHTAADIGAATPGNVTNIVRDLSLGGIWDETMHVWWTPRMRNGSLTYEATTNVNLNAGN